MEQFTLVGLPDRTFAAVRFSDPWESWVVPVLARDQLTTFAAAAGVTLAWDGTVAVVNGERYPADHVGLYLFEAGFELQKAIPVDAPPFTFAGDWELDTEYRCWGFDTPWNGWDAPIVDRNVLERLMDGLEDRVQWDGTTAVIGREAEDEEVRLEPDAKGLYHLRDLGWTFVSEDG